MKIVYVHGYGGKDFDAEVARDISLASAKSGRQVPAHTHAWLVHPVKLKFLGKMWEEAKALADKESPKLARLLSETAEMGPVFVVGHSLGCRVILRAMKRLEPEVQLEAVFLLAPAVDKNYSVLALASKSRRGVFAYHSPSDDVLKNVYRAAEGVAPAGMDGFDDGLSSPGLGVTNLRVNRGHNSYTRVAEGVGEVIGYWANSRKPQPEVSVGGPRGNGEVWWDTILASNTKLLQRHHISQNYRVLDKLNENRRVGWGLRAAPLLGFLAQDDERLR